MRAEPGREFRVASEKRGRLHFMFEGLGDPRCSIIQELKFLLESTLVR